MKVKLVEYYLGIDFGEARIGLALANSIARLPSPYAVLPNDKDVFATIEQIISNEKIDKVVVGLPRNMAGQETGQSRRVRDFARQLAEKTAKIIEFADESLSSIRAKGSKNYKPTSPKYQDDIAACYILEEFLNEKF